MHVLPQLLVTDVLPRAAWDDALLLHALSLHDELAFAELYGRYWQPLFLLACRKLHRPAEAEEVVQDLFVTLWHKRHTAASIQGLEPYLFAALKYRIIDCLRAQQVRKTYAAGVAPAAPDRSTEEAVAAADLAAALTAGVGSLPGPAQRVFQLSRMEHRSVPEIAAQLQVSPKTVEYHLARALKLLRRYLGDFLVSGVLLLWQAW